MCVLKEEWPVLIKFTTNLFAIEFMYTVMIRPKLGLVYPEVKGIIQ
jgi:hypothetical protein